MTRYFAAYADNPEEFNGQNLNVGMTYSTYEEAVKARESYERMDEEEWAIRLKEEGIVDESAPINIFEMKIIKVETKKSCIDCMFYCKDTSTGYHCCSSQMHGPFIGSEDTNGGCNYWMMK